MATPEREDREGSSAHRAENVSMRELLAACAAASAVSTPPRERETPEPAAVADDEPEAVRPVRPARDEAA
ncbi:hypothetical protein ACFYU9_13095 [Streptomyces sp. NPDC004327]|uniref:hypothetical protein n=1 Tax=unclassified Streptomyces TaxID=2593676 RepID=UPI0036AE34E8